MRKEREIMKDNVEKGKGEGWKGGMMVWGKDKEGKGRGKGKGIGRAEWKGDGGGWLRKVIEGKLRMDKEREIIKDVKGAGVCRKGEGWGMWGGNEGMGKK